MNELIVNLHMHTRYSDGHGTHADIARAALQAGLDVVIVTDHNVWVNGPEDYYREGDKRVLLMVGEEIHDTTRDPQKNHMLVYRRRARAGSLCPESSTLAGCRESGGGGVFPCPSG